MLDGHPPHGLDAVGTVAPPRRGGSSGLQCGQARIRPGAGMRSGSGPEWVLPRYSTSFRARRPRRGDRSAEAGSGRGGRQNTARSRRPSVPRAAASGLRHDIPVLGSPRGRRRWGVPPSSPPAGQSLPALAKRHHPMVEVIHFAFGEDYQWIGRRQQHVAGLAEAAFMSVPSRSMLKQPWWRSNCCGASRRGWKTCQATMTKKRGPQPIARTVQGVAVGMTGMVGRDQHALAASQGLLHMAGMSRFDFQRAGVF